MGAAVSDGEHQLNLYRTSPGEGAVDVHCIHGEIKLSDPTLVASRHRRAIYTHQLIDGPGSPRLCDLGEQILSSSVAAWITTGCAIGS